MHAGRTPSLEIHEQVVEGEPGVNDVLDEQDMTTFQRRIKILFQADNAAFLNSWQ